MTDLNAIIKAPSPGARRLSAGACLIIIFSLLMTLDILSQVRNKNLLEKKLEEKEAIILWG